MKNLFNDDYFERGIESGLSCYSNYRWIPELTIPMCSDIISYLNISDTDTILDFGCSKGFIVKGMRLLHREAYGVDISEYAISVCPNDVKDYLFLLPPDGTISLQNRKYDWAIAKDVLEHVDYVDITKVLTNIKNASRNLFAIIPLGKDGKYVIPAYELDVTHKIRETMEWWIKIFKQCGFIVKSAEYKVKHIKENWAQWEHGNGFFVLE